MGNQLEYAEIGISGCGIYILSTYLIKLLPFRIVNVQKPAQFT